jgi:hypothetical protein
MSSLFNFNLTLPKFLTFEFWEHLFNPVFWGSVEWTVIALVLAFTTGFFFPEMRRIGGATILTVLAYWYGFHKGQKSRGD